MLSMKSTVVRVDSRPTPTMSVLSPCARAARAITARASSSFSERNSPLVPSTMTPRTAVPLHCSRLCSNQSRRRSSDSSNGVTAGTTIPRSLSFTRWSLLFVHCPAAVHQQILTGDAAGRRRGEEEDGVGHLAHLQQASQGNPRRHVAEPFLVLEVVLGHRRQHVSRADGVDLDAVLAAREREGAPGGPPPPP